MMEKPQIPRFQERKEKREELKEFLPADLQLIYGTDVKPSKWHFGGELLKRRQSEETADKLFFKALDEYNNNKTIETNLFSEVLKDKQETAQLMIYDCQLQTGLKELADNHEWDDYAYLLIKMSDLGKVNFNNPQYKRINEYIKGQPEEDGAFLLYNISANLVLDKDLLKYQKDQYHPWQALRQTSLEINKEQTENKQVKNPEKWWQENSYFLGRFLALGNLAIALVKEKLPDGIPYLEGMKRVYKEAIENNQSLALIYKTIADNKLSYPHELGTFVEITSAFTKANKLDILAQVVETTEAGKINETASRELLKITVQELGISPEKIADSDLKKWKADYLPNLISNDVIMQGLIKDGDKGYENARELYRELLKSVFEGRFDDFLTNEHQAGEVGRDVARHNAQIKQTYEKLGIPWDKWLNYDKTQDFIVSTEIKVNARERNQKLLAERAGAVLRALKPLEAKLTEREYQPLIHILSGTNKKKDLSQVKGEELKTLLANLEERLQNLCSKQEYQDWAEWNHIFEHMGHLREAVETVLKTGESLSETREKGFRIKLWDRDPRKDFFQGNYTHCCIAVGVKNTPPEGGLTTHDPSTIMHYLADQGIQVAEILDENERDPIGNTWLFVSQNELGEPILIADNVEINKRYKDVHVNNAIRDNLLKFLENYARETNMAGAYLGKVSTNDIDDDNLGTKKLPPVDKVGGYLAEYTSHRIRPGRYYLETYNHQELAVIWDGQENRHLQKEKSEKNKNGFVIISDLDGLTRAEPLTPETIRAAQQSGRIAGLDISQIRQSIEEIENKSFEGAARQSTDEIWETIQNPRGLQMIVRKEGRIVGYLSSRPADTFLPPVSHAEYDSSPEVLYIESIAGNFDPFETIRIIKEKAQEAGYKKIALHGINQQLNKALARFGFKTKATVKNWLGATAAYMEMEL